MKLTATDRKTLIRLASSMEKGSPERKAILAGLSKSVVANAAGKADKNAARGERNPALQKDLTKKLKRDLHVLDQGWTQKGGGDISPDQWKLIFGRYRLKSLKVGDSFTYDKRWDLYETDAEAVIKPANAEAAAGLNAYAEDGTSTLVERGGLLYLKFRAALDANPNWVPEGRGVHYAELKKTAGMAQQYAPNRLYPFMQEMKLKLSFDQLAAREKGYKLTNQISDKEVFKIIEKLTKIRLPKNVKIPMEKSLESYLMWLAQWAAKHRQMSWDEPYAWAVPAGVQLGFMEDSMERGATQKFAAKKDMGGTDVRHPLYEAGDKITALEDLAGEPPLAGDAKYKSLAKKLSRAHDDLRKHLDANYNWD